VARRAEQGHPLLHQQLHQGSSGRPAAGCPGGRLRPPRGGRDDAGGSGRGLRGVAPHRPPAAPVVCSVRRHHPGARDGGDSGIG
jgi:hypothetical protein